MKNNIDVLCLTETHVKCLSFIIIIFIYQCRYFNDAKEIAWLAKLSMQQKVTDVALQFVKD